jgi:hypothetical protein
MHTVSFHAFIKPEGVWQRSQEPATGPYSVDTLTLYFCEIHFDIGF